MSVDLYVYVPSLSHEMIPAIINRIKTAGVECELAPGSVLLDDSGFLPIRMRVVSPDAPAQIRGQDLITGFEYGVNNFDYASELKQKPKSEPVGILQRLFGSRGSKSKSSEPKFIVNSETDKILSGCKQTVLLKTKSACELLIRNCFAAALAEIGNGIVYDAQNADWMLPESAFKLVSDAMRNCDALADCEAFTGWDRAGSRSC